MLVIFLLGFILDFIEITFVVVPIVGPVLMAVDPIWLGVLIAVNLQTSFDTLGFALFYLRGVAPVHWRDLSWRTALYRPAAGAAGGLLVWPVWRHGYRPT